ncbi:Bug family tripartite tricarboxylate transporter substrate binding protein [Halomonas alkalisoli]|uniref:Bug family tripartite tricarboxylate transporter substrate binding protein n=1 Tax=Halomonas alkalisoli TaxID=2907158 RepID=UPI001F384E28|nr:tripartite tricarboxylate transporter substrate binding protein [Halomonas alkalisoli]MCE9680795.1 tripartite tricarboxylate transporter substrate binding protein [Halomonas alkalisoli]
MLTLNKSNVTSRNSLRWAATTLAGVSLAVGGIAATAQADDYPNSAVEFIVPWGPGGGSDVLMRLVSNHIEPHLGQPMPVINMPGVSGTTGLADLADRDNDGYTVGQVHDGFMVSHHTGLTEYNWDDYEPVAAITASPQYLTVSADSPWETFADFVEYAQDNPGEIRFGVTLGGVPHIHGAMIEEAEDLSFRYVGFEGTGERIRSLVGGHIDAAMGDIASSLQFVENDDLRFLAVGHTERMTQTPDVPTFAELGYDNLNLSILRGLIAPQGTPQDRIEVLAAAVEAIAADEAFVTRINNAGAEVQFMGPNEYREHLAALDATIERLAGNLQQ